MKNKLQHRAEQKRLFELLRRKKWTLTEASEHLGIFPSAMSRYVSLERELPKERFEALVDLIENYKPTKKPRLKKLQ